jgi:hypothetical protein
MVGIPSWFLLLNILWEDKLEYIVLRFLLPQLITEMFNLGSQNKPPATLTHLRMNWQEKLHENFPVQGVAKLFDY